MTDKIIIYPTAYGFEVLASWPHPALTQDTAWRPAAEIVNAKRFPDEVAARTFVRQHLSRLAPAEIVIRDASA